MNKKTKPVATKRDAAPRMLGPRRAKNARYNRPSRQDPDYSWGQAPRTQV